MTMTSPVRRHLAQHRFVQKSGAGFTLIEILLVVAAIAILAGIVILAINPPKQIGGTRNAARAADVNTILSAVHQYEIDNGDSFLNSISTSPIEICITGASDCTGYQSLSFLTDSEKYLVSIPLEPLKTNAGGAGYTIKKDAYNRVTVAAQYAENGATISATR